MANDPRALAAFAIVTAAVNGDREAWMEATSAFDNPAAALGALSRVSEALVGMIADLLGVNRQEALHRIGLAINQPGATGA
jgi:hypothetical protein